jgi:hypothetical protein
MLIGLIALIPVAGTMNLFGYTLVTSRNLRAGYLVLPPASFSFIEAGAPAALLALAWSFVTLFLFLAVGGGVGVVTYQQTHDWAWTVALSFAGAITVASLVALPYRILQVAALHLSGRERWAIFRVGRLVRYAREHWRATWYGVGVLLLWSAGYLAVSLVAGFVPFGSILVAIMGLSVMAAMLAVALARFDDPPAGFTQGWANLLAAVVVGFSLLSIGLVWGVGTGVASYVSSHPEEVACFFDSSCNSAYSGSLQTITNVQHDPQNPATVKVNVTFINHSQSAATIDPGDYLVRTAAGETLPPSSDCPAPGTATVPPGGRLQQEVCFRLPDAQGSFDLRLPWTGWDYRTGPVYCPSPSTTSRPPTC